MLCVWFDCVVLRVVWCCFDSFALHAVCAGFVVGWLCVVMCCCLCMLCVLCACCFMLCAVVRVVVFHEVRVCVLLGLLLSAA